MVHDVKAFQRFAVVHALIHNHFNLERHLATREIFKRNRTPLWTSVVNSQQILGVPLSPWELL
jgi:hypothetical protein